MLGPQRPTLVLAIGVFAIAALIGAMVLPPSTSLAQSQPQLVPLVTDQTPLALSNQFGAPLNSLINQNGDYAFVGNSASALYYRPSGVSALTRVIQLGDEVPGYPGSRNEILQQIRMNNSGLLVVRLDFFLSTGASQGAIWSYNGTSFQQVISGNDPAPGAGGAPFGRNIGLGGVNDGGDISFSAPLIPGGSILPPQPTLYIKPSGGAPVRVAGFGDVAPGTGGGAYSNFNLLGFNNQGEQLFLSSITGGINATALFVGNVSGVRKVVAPGDANPGGGTFPTINPAAFINNSGAVAFQAGPVIYIDTPGVGISRLLGSGDALPAPVGGTIGAGSSLQSFGDGGDAALSTSVIGSPITATAIAVRKRLGNPIELVAYRSQAAPGAPGQTFATSFTGISVNATGTVSFRATLTGGPILNGVFQQTGANPPINIALDGQAVPAGLSGTHTLAITSPTTTLNNGAILFKSDIEGGPADYAEILNAAGTSTVLMNTGDSLPAGSRTSLRTFRVGASGDSVGFLAQRTAGRPSIAVHSIANQETNVLVTDGDVAPGTGGGLIRLVTRNTVFQNTGGTTVFTAQIIGGSLPSNMGLFVRSPGGTLTKVAANGDIDPLTGRTFTAITLNAVTPSPLNDNGQVVFLTTLTGGISPPTRSLYRFSTATGFTKIAAVNDLTSAGATITAFPNAALAINASGQVAFVAQTGAAQGIYVGSGATPAKVVAAGDAGPSGTTFALFATPSFNDNADIAFMATLTGGPAAGMFIGSTSAAPTALAIDGAAAPGGGNYSITTLRPDIVTNNQHDVVFRANLTGATADSAYFVRRGLAGPLQPLVMQGQAAPGTTGGVFETITPGINNLVSENFQLGPDGDIAFQNFFLAGGQRTLGIWHIRPSDNGLEEILVRGTVATEFGGGSMTVSTASTAWNTGGRYPVWGRISGGTFTDGIFLFVPVTQTNTPAGTSVPVNVVDSTTGTSPVTLTFDNVVTSGQTTLTTSSGGPTVPTAFALGNPPIFYNLETTATFSGSITICIDFSNITFPPGAPLRLLHFDGTSWVNVTTSGPTGNVICGSVTSLSPFAVVQSLDTTPPTLSVSLSPDSIWPNDRRMVQITATIQTADDFDASPQVRLISITSNEVLGAGDVQAVLNEDTRSFQLRATRSGGGSGRIYSVTYRATDASGNSTTATATVVVLHDQGK